MEKAKIDKGISIFRVCTFCGQTSHFVDEYPKTISVRPSTKLTPTSNGWLLLGKSWQKYVADILEVDTKIFKESGETNGPEYLCESCTRHIVIADAGAELMKAELIQTYKQRLVEPGDVLPENSDSSDLGQNGGELDKVNTKARAFSEATVGVMDKYLMAGGPKTSTSDQAEACNYPVRPGPVVHVYCGHQVISEFGNIFPQDLPPPSDTAAQVMKELTTLELTSETKADLTKTKATKASQNKKTRKSSMFGYGQRNYSQGKKGPMKK